MSKPVLFLVGPTGSGKTELSLRLAERLGAEIVSADSMLVYRGMNIGAAKPAPAERRKIRHHLIDLASPRSQFSAYRLRRLALKSIQEISKRSRIPLVVSGGGLYLHAVLKGISAPGGGNPLLRRKWLEEEKKKGLPFLYEQLQRIDPARAEAVHPHDRIRIIRALEIAAVSGKTPSEWYERKKPTLEDLGFSVCVVGIARERADLYKRINGRVETMFRRGFLREVKRLKRRGFSLSAKQALGYREALDYLKREGAENKLQELLQLIQTRTRQFAKRQLTWFRRDKEIRWIDWPPGEPAARVCDKMIKEIKPWLETAQSL